MSHVLTIIYQLQDALVFSSAVVHYSSVHTQLLPRHLSDYNK